MSSERSPGTLYTSYFGLKEAPFSITPDPAYLYMSVRHQEALAHLLFGVKEGGGFVQLTGEVGTGKTTLCRYLVKQLEPDIDVALILNPRLTAAELIATVCDELRIPYDPASTTLKAQVDALYRHLLTAHAEGRRTVLLVDEAQNLAMDVLEQIRLLTNLETEKEKLLQIILIGQPELIDLLARPELRQLAQRITARYHLHPLSLTETAAYIRHRMRVAGQNEVVFTRGAARQVYRITGGVPRLINVVCDRALLGAYAREQNRVGRDLVRRAAAEVLGKRAVSRRALVGWSAAAAAAVLVAAAGTWLALGRPDLPSWVPSWSVSVRGEAPAATAAPSPAPPRFPAAASAALPDGTTMEPPPATAAELPGPSLADLVGEGFLPTDPRSAFAAVFERWGTPFDPAGGGSACEQAARRGLRCLFRSGTWFTLRRFDLPAILELIGPDGARRYAAVVSVDATRATLVFDGQERTFTFGEVDQLWDGDFIVLWRPPALSTVPLVPGMRSRDVEWLRQRLAELDGRPLDAVAERDYYDDQLRQRVMAFQRSRQLIPDGIVGEETLTHLSARSRGENAPRLQAAAR